MSIFIDISLNICDDTLLKTKTVLFMEVNIVNILVLIPPYAFDANKQGIAPNKAMLPVGPLVVAELFRDRGHNVTVLDLVFNQDWTDILPEQAPDILLVSCHTARNIPVCREILDVLGERWKWRPHPYTVLGGNVCLEFGYREFAKQRVNLDAVVRGFAHGMQAIEAIENKQGGDIISANSEDLGLSAVDLLSTATHDQYLERSQGRYPLYGFGFGCDWSCSYCASKMSSRFIDRRLDRIAKEIRLAKRLGYRELWCVDNLMLRNSERAAWFDELVSEQGMIWSGMTRPEYLCRLDDGFLNGLTALREVAMGVESANFQILDTLNRGFGSDDTHYLRLRRAFGKVNAAGIASNAFVMLDLPESKKADFWMLHMLLRFINPSTVSWSFYNPPVAMALQQNKSLTDFGFYRWPLGFSQVSAHKVVQQAMLLSGQYWDKYTPNLDKPFWETADEFGVNFLECQILQKKDSRSPIGDIWETWIERRTDEDT